MRNNMEKLVIIHENDDGSMLVSDSWGETQYMTKEEYNQYLININKLEENERQ